MQECACILLQREHRYISLLTILMSGIIESEGIHILNFSKCYQQMIQCDCRNFDYQQYVSAIFMVVILSSSVWLCMYACCSLMIKEVDGYLLGLSWLNIPFKFYDLVLLPLTLDLVCALSLSILLSQSEAVNHYPKFCFSCLNIHIQHAYIYT